MCLKSFIKKASEHTSINEDFMNEIQALRNMIGVNHNHVANSYFKNNKDIWSRSNQAKRYELVLEYINMEINLFSYDD